MARTLDDAYTDVRRALSDVLAGNYRHSDDRIVDAINDAFVQALRIRPDLFLSLSFTAPSYTTSQLNTAVQLGIDDQYYPAIVNYATGWIEMADDEFTLDGRSIALMGAMKAELLGIEVR